MKYRSAALVAFGALLVTPACSQAEENPSAPADTAVSETVIEEEEITTEITTETEVEAPEQAAAPEPAEAPQANRTMSVPPPEARLGSHTHGHAMLAVTRQGSSISVSLEAPLSAFGVTENPQTEEDRAAIEAIRNDLTNDANLVELRGNVSCDISSKGMATRVANGHGELQMETSYSCQNADALQAIRFGGFGTYPALSEVEAVYVSDTEQAAGNLTRTNPELRIN
ncbi:DUF2796 domain-containing protein [Thalassovita mediterranea]|nr:DUF2796 domain-containing protein [Thalassovita mediterranea]